MNRIFINYRREDALLYADQLQEVLSEHFGRDEVFRDVDTIEMGLDFAEAIDRALSQADIMLVLIGRHWLVSPDGRARLQEPDDYVRLEVAGGLARPNVRVIPVLVGGATMPRHGDLPEDLAPLIRRHAFELTDTRFRHDRDELVRRLGRVLEGNGTKTGEPAEAQAGETNGVRLPPREPPAPGAPPSAPVAPPTPPSAEAAFHAAGAPTPPQARSKRLWIALAAAAALAAIGIVIAVLALGDDGPVPPVDAAITVPDVVGQSEDEARTTLEGRGFEVSSTLVADEGEAGLVLSQDPAAGAESDEGDVVTLDVSQAPLDALLAMVPSAIRPDCQEDTSDDFPSSAVAKARCLSGRAVAVQYNLFADEQTMTEAFEESLAREEENLGRSIPAGNCEGDRFAQGPYTVDGTEAGRVFCYVKEGSSWIEWMDRSLLVFSFALRDDMRDDLLYRWWTRSSGPVAPPE